jgi:hypothetical protein
MKMYRRRSPIVMGDSTSDYKGLIAEDRLSVLPYTGEYHLGTISSSLV